MNDDFEMAIDSFEWESKEQREGYLALVHYLRKFGIQPKLPLDYEAAFFIQKDVDSHAYWREAVGSQVGMLQEEIRSLQGKLDEAMATMDGLSTAVKSQLVAIQALTKGL